MKENISKVIIWISNEFETYPDKDTKVVIKEAILHFDLSPFDAEFIHNFYKTLDKQP